MTLPAGWVETTIGELAQLVTSGSRGWAKYYGSSGDVFVRIQNIARGSLTLDLTDVQRVVPPRGSEGERTRLLDQDILVSITADLGRVAVFTEVSTAYINQHIALVRLRDASFARFVAMFLASDHGQLQLGLMDRGVTRAGLGLRDIGDVAVPLPPIAEQRRIVEKLGVLTAATTYARAELGRVIALAESLRRSAVLAAFRGELTREWREQHKPSEVSDSDLHAAYTQRAMSGRRKPPSDIDWQPEFDVPLSWRWVALDQVIALTQYGTSAKTGDDPTGVPVLRMGNLKRGQIDWSDLKFLPPSHSEFPDIFLEPGDILFNRTNSFELVGKSAVFKGAETPTSFASYLIRLRATAILPNLIVRYLNSSIGREWVRAVATQQVGQANVNGSKLRGLAIPLPPRDEQIEIDRKLDATFARADRLEAEAARAIALLDRLRGVILAKAFRGELVPQDPNEEPASVLLERICASRAAAPKTTRKRRAKAG